MLTALSIAILFLALGLFLTWRGTAEACGVPLAMSGESSLTLAVTEKIPRIIWGYWHSEDRPLVVQHCLRNWKFHNPDFQINLLHAGNVRDFLPHESLPAHFSGMTKQRQADWLRLALLERHGGIWLDASIFLTTPLDWVLAAQDKKQVDYVGFYIEGFTDSDKFPVIENWCMAAPRGSQFIRNWLAEFTSALSLGDRAYLDQLKSQGIYERTLQRISMPEYLLSHVAAQYVLQNMGPCSFYVVKAEDSAYFYQAKSNWRRRRLFWRLLFLRCPAAVPAMVKLRGGERNKLEKFLRWKLYRRAGVVGAHLARADE